MDAGALPIDDEARAWFSASGADPVHDAIAGGDDYELLFAVGPRTRSRLAAAQRAGATLTRIGSCTADRRIVLRSDGRDAPWPRGYSHFR